MRAPWRQSAVRQPRCSLSACGCTLTRRAGSRRRRRVDELIPELKFNFAPRIIDIKRHFSFLLFEVAQGNRIGHFTKWTCAGNIPGHRSYADLPVAGR